jgi:hypothetical protein
MRSASRAGTDETNTGGNMEYNLPLTEVLKELERRYGVDEQTDEEIEWLMLMSELDHNQ